MFASLLKLFRVGNETPGVRERGGAGEALAVRHLERNGLRIVERNWRCSSGEIDIVARDGEELVIVEVKSAGRVTEFKPEDRVNYAKRQKLKQLAAAYLRARKLDAPVRYDVVAVVWIEGEARLTHYENAFQ